ncbi:MAG: M48 family metallopeptidase [Akkermansiaceae bacterium]
MNFFEAQERARKSSRMLVLWFIMAMFGVIAVMYVIATLIFQFTSVRPSSADNGFAHTPPTTWWDGERAITISLLVGGVILIGSWSKLAQLSGGGKVVARSLGGRALEPNTTDFKERRLLNVVEEMAIASGVPVPEVWIMDEEEGINAFAAGTDPTNAVIGITRGTLDRLTRSELQGVVAHEFSHILNGDMKLNIRLMGWIFGLVMLSMLGRIMLESFRFMRGSRDSKGGGVVLAIVLAGLGVWIVGSIGVLFARLLQSAISRQREYLADASAVQFTRDPEGIAGALKKIGGFSNGGKITSPAAIEARHMFFAGSGFSSLMATHPPLDLRIKAIEPNWNGKMLQGMTDRASGSDVSGSMNFAGQAAPIRDVSELEGVVESSFLDSHVGEVLRNQLREDEITSFSKDQAKALLLGLLVIEDSDGISNSKNLLRTHSVDDSVIAEIVGWSQKLSGFTSAKKLALVDLSLSWLRKMNRGEGAEFVAVSQALIESDGEVNLFEFMLQKVIRRHVEIGLGIKSVPSIRFRKLVDLEQEVGDLLGAFGELAGDSGALENAMSEYRQHTGRDIQPRGAGLAAVAVALEKMDSATPMVKQQILRMSGLVVTADNQIVDSEVELLRATAEAIGAPIPPWVRIAA